MHSAEESNPIPSSCTEMNCVDVKYPRLFFYTEDLHTTPHAMRMINIHSIIIDVVRRGEK